MELFCENSKQHWAVNYFQKRFYLRCLTWFLMRLWVFCHKVLLKKSFPVHGRVKMKVSHRLSKKGSTISIMPKTSSERLCHFTSYVNLRCVQGQWHVGRDYNTVKPEADPGLLQHGALCDNSYRLKAVNYYHKVVHLGRCNSPRSASVTY